MESFVALVFFIVLYFTYTRPILKENKRIKREEAEKAARAKKWEEEEIKRINERKEAEKKHNEEVLSKVSYPDPITSSDEEILMFLEKYYCEDSDVWSAYLSSQLIKKNDSVKFLQKFFDYDRKKSLTKY